jgi:DNA repair protein RadD
VSGALVPSIACAGLGEVDVTGSPVIGTPQTLAPRLDGLGRVDLLVIDEAHRLGRKASGQIHSILTALRERNDKLMVLGLTATPFRLDSGPMTAGADAAFDVVAHDVGYLDLVRQGFLAPLVGPLEEIERLEVAGLRLVGGDYSAADLARFDDAQLTERIAEQIVLLGRERRSWLVFGVSIRHAEHLAQALIERGIDARPLTGSTPAQERAELVAGFKAGAVRCLVGVDVFSVGFDAPAVDLIAIARPTASAVWHVQSAGRGTRLAPGKTDCMVLDFAGNFARLGPIEAPQVRRKGERARGDHDAPLARCCPHCGALVAARAASCPVCGAVLIEHGGRRTDALGDVAPDIDGSATYEVRAVRYAVHQKDGRPDSLKIEYLLVGRATVREWLVCWHTGQAGTIARAQWLRRLDPAAPRRVPRDASEAACVAASRLKRPSHVRLWQDGEFTRVVPIFAEQAN